MRYSIEEKDQVLTIRQTLTGRLLSGLATFGFGLGASVVMLVVFYLPDYVGDSSQREGSSTFFAFYIVGTALLIAAIAGIMQALSRSTWRIDKGKGELHWVSKTASGRLLDDRLPLEHVKAVELVRRKSWAGSHEVLFRFDNGTDVTLASGRLGLAELEALQERASQALLAECEPRKGSKKK